MAWQRSFTRRGNQFHRGTVVLALALLASCSSPPAPTPTEQTSQRPKTVDAAVEALFAANGVDGSDRTHAVVVMQNGRIIAERYADGFAAQTRFPSWSIAKTMTALIVGVMVSDGRLALDSPAPVAAWQQPGDPRAQITLRQMLTMSSGLRHNEDDPPLSQSDAIRLLFLDEAADTYAAARARPIADAPGSRFLYSSATTQILTGMVTDQLVAGSPTARDPKTRRDAMEAFLRSRIIEPAGLSSLRVEYDAAGTLLGTAFMHMTARDYARLGEFLRVHGRINGQQIVSDRWIEFMTSPSALNAGYGGHLWLNRSGAERALFVGRLSRSIYGATGLWGQMVVVVPERDLVVVRLGVTPSEEEPAMRERVAQLIETVPTN